MILYQTQNSTKAYNIDVKLYDDFRYIPHLHKDFEFVHVISGRLFIKVDGRESIMKAGDSALILSNEVHSFETPQGEGSVVFVAVFASDYVRDFAARAENKSGSKSVFTLPEGDADFLYKRFIGKVSVPDRLILCSCLNLICADFLAAVPLCDRAEKSDKESIHKILRYIGENYTEDVTLERAAEELCYEKHYLSRLFHGFFGMNFRKFVNEYRVDLAQSILSSGEKIKMTELAYRCGFQSVRSFNRAYKSITGKAPKMQK